MKTIVFALQVFGIIALLPVCVVLEMNHGTSSVSTLKTTRYVAENPSDVSLDFNSFITTYPIAVLTLKQGSVKTKKKSGNTCCSCRNCNCGSSCTCADL